MTLYLSNRDGDGKTSEEGHYRLQTQILTNDVLGSSSLQVTQNSPVGMSVLVGTGDFKIYTGANYSYTGWNSSVATVTISTSDPANPRITTIVLYVDKSATTSPSPPNNPGIIKLKSVDGTPSAVPVAPNGTTIQSSVGSGNPYIILANVTVPAAATTIVTANISDQRQLLRITDNLVVTNSIQDGAVTSGKISTGGVATINIADSAITTTKIADSNVTTVKLANNAVTAAKIETQQSWQTLGLVNSWVVFSTEYNDPQYMKDSLGFVHVRGLVKSGTTGLIATLPAGYRPARRNIWATASNNLFGRLDVLANGQIIAGGAGGPYSASWFSLDVIYFKAEG